MPEESVGGMKNIDLELLIDSDTFFYSLVDPAYEVSIDGIAEVMASDDPEVEEMLNLFFMITRYIIIPTSQFLRNSKKEYDEFVDTQRMAYREAARLTAFYLQNMNAIPVEWATIYADPIKESLRDKYNNIDDIRIVPTLEARFQAKVKERNVISISILTREFLKNFNLMLWNLIFKETESEQDEDFDFLKVNDHQILMLCNTLLPYFIFLNDNLRVDRLPVLTAYSKDALACAFKTTSLQMKIILCHEYGHIVSGHLKDGANGKKDDIEKEYEADALSLQIVSQLEDEKQYGDIWISFRWFMQYMMIEEIVGTLLHDENTVQFDDLLFEKRKNNLYKYIKTDKMPRADNLFEARGTVFLMHLKKYIVDMGASWLREQADELCR